ncbi:MAG: hypothetical protein WCL28_12530 [bacterium]
MGHGSGQFSKFLVDHNSGMSLPEVMVSVAITSVVGYLAFGLITDFNQRAWEHEAKSKAIDERELAANIIKRELPQFITSVTGRYGEEIPPGDFWACNSSSCKMTIKYEYQDINGGTRNSLDLFPLEAKCVDVLDARLAQSGVGLNTKAVGTLGQCLSCPNGKAPQVSVRMYRFNPTSGEPSVVTTKLFPQNVGKMKDQGVLAMGICVDWPPYQYNVGTAATPLNVNRYDRWVVTLLPVFPRYAQHGGMTAGQISASLVAADSSVLITPSKRLGPEFKYTPLK